MGWERRLREARGHRTEAGLRSLAGGPTVTPGGRLLAEATAGGPSWASSRSTLVRTPSSPHLPGDPVGADN